jgi:antitoxin component HigA of HigAB toxin-antitoxin module
MKIKNETEYQKALERMGEIFFAQPGTPEGDEVEQLNKTILEYEKSISDSITENVTEADVRAYLQDQGTSPEMIEKVVKETFEKP